ncbi:MAG TPA: sulfurtransferase [Candidatus Limnocylindrales bacterium]|jgi:thiosulfate/3-mercaptopyruvate sulfurtransferase|nr:sulfurtransferase [Candidatus Limnocylindrales bacterium]
MMLMSPEELATRLDDPAIQIADVRWYVGAPDRGRLEYEQAHIPGAIFVDLDRDLAAPRGPGRHPLPDPRVFAARLGRLGFGSDNLIVAYDDSLGTIAARLWWMLDNLGHDRVALLDGGLKAWRAAGLPESREVPSPIPVSTPELADHWTRVIDRDELVDRLAGLTLLDARVPERYRGDVEPVDARAGHIPSAVNAPAKLSLAADGRFLAPDELAERLGSIAPSDRPVAVSCGSGVTACHTAFALRLAGLPDPLLYPGSFSDWSRTELPVAVGSEPGDPASPGADSR